MVNVAATGAVTSTGGSDSVLGGLARISRPGENFGRIEQSWAGGRIVGEGKVGGLVSQNVGSIIQSYTLGSTVSAGEQGAVGRLAGEQRNYRAVLLRGPVNRSAFLGGMVGSNAGTIRGSYAVSNLTAARALKRSAGLQGAIAAGSRQTYFGTMRHRGISRRRAGTAVAVSSGLNSMQIIDQASYGPHWNFSPSAVWALPTYAGSGLRRSPGT